MKYSDSFIWFCIIKQVVILLFWWNMIVKCSCGYLYYKQHYFSTKCCILEVCLHWKMWGPSYNVTWSKEWKGQVFLNFYVGKWPGIAKTPSVGIHYAKCNTCKCSILYIWWLVWSINISLTVVKSLKSSKTLSPFSYKKLGVRSLSTKYVCTQLCLLINGGIFSQW